MGRVTAELARLIGTHVHDHGLGVVYGAAIAEVPAQDKTHDDSVARGLKMP